MTNPYGVDAGQEVFITIKGNELKGKIIEGSEKRPMYNEEKDCFLIQIDERKMPTYLKAEKLFIEQEDEKKDKKKDDKENKKDTKDSDKKDDKDSKDKKIDKKDDSDKDSKESKEEEDDSKEEKPDKDDKKKKTDKDDSEDKKDDKKSDKEKKKKKESVDKKLTEAKSLRFQIMYVNAMDSVDVFLDSRNAGKVEDVRKQAYEELKKVDPTASDDFWIDDIMVVGGTDILNINWQAILTSNGSHLDQKAVNKVFDEPEEYVMKVQFLNEHNYDITEDRLEEVMIYDASGEDWIEGNWNIWLPEEWMVERIEDRKDIPKWMVEELQSYFIDGFARMFSDEEPNGTAIYDRIGDYFVYTYNV